MAKKKFKKIDTLLVLRRISQIGIGTILLNGYFKVFTSKQIYDGPLKYGCVPGLNCHACPSATMGCPIGMLQHFMATHRFPFYLIAFLAIIGLLSGRFTCGWLCPFGLLQDSLHWFKKLRIRIPKALNYFKYVVLVVVTIAIPYFTYEHWFSKLCPCGALIAGIPWALWNPTDPNFEMPVIPAEAMGAMFFLKLWILGVFFVLFLLIKRPFCRTICPLGAIYALFNRISLVSLKVKESCTNCGMCNELCPMDLDISTEINSENCIKCLDCLQCDHVEYYWNLPWKPDDPVQIDYGGLQPDGTLKLPEKAESVSCK
ncbi:MAG: 4Fe-4S binding protein [Candidatus Electryoneaceae bacterium]|nr:4Fe-4S binding protein [Candidatus Electryoneaceae bacterium]